MTTTRNYDNLNRLTSIGTVDYQGNALGSFGYTYNALNQRSQITAADGTYWTYGYDALGQVISGQKYWSNGTAVEGQGFGYTFDGNGNRTAATINGRSATYSPTLIDQYSQRTVPGYVEVSGTALASASVLVNGTAPARQGGYYFEELSATNTAAPVFTTVTAQATISGSTNTLTGHVYTPQTPEAFTYDTDGNLTQNGRWNYTWDAENRLISMAPISTVPAAAKKTLQFAYDYLGRRISKSVATWNTSTGAYRTPVETRFIYDGWNLVAETDATGKLLRNYVWGTDLSGTPQGAGGIGGLLMVTNAAPTLGQSHTYFPTYDGNGNITSLIKSTDAISRASYEYGPFGEVLRQSGEYATINPFRFSTKYEDEETGLDYFGLRYYESSTGRWLSRDPIEEPGGCNLYAFVSNYAVGRTDLLGAEGIDRLFAAAIGGVATGGVSFVTTMLTGGSARDALIGASGAFVTGAVTTALLYPPPFCGPRTAGSIGGAAGNLVSSGITEYYRYKDKDGKEPKVRIVANLGASAMFGVVAGGVGGHLGDGRLGETIPNIPVRVTMLNVNIHLEIEGCTAVTDFSLGIFSRALGIVQETANGLYDAANEQVIQEGVNINQTQETHPK